MEEKTRRSRLGKGTSSVNPEKDSKLFDKNNLTPQVDYIVFSKGAQGTSISRVRTAVASLSVHLRRSAATPGRAYAPQPA